MDLHTYNLARFLPSRGTLSENIDRPSAELYEEMGIETDEVAGADFRKAELLMGTGGGSVSEGPFSKRPRKVLTDVNK